MQIRALLLGVQQFENALGRGHSRLQKVDHGSRLVDGLRELSGVLDECLDLSQTH